jgi:hypothetical protein
MECFDFGIVVKRKTFAHEVTVPTSKRHKQSIKMSSQAQLTPDLMQR